MAPRYAVVRVLGAVVSVLVGLALDFFIVWFLFWLSGLPVRIDSQE